jgi:hypothetical protein
MFAVLCFRPDSFAVKMIFGGFGKQKNVFVLLGTPAGNAFGHRVGFVPDDVLPQICLLFSFKDKSIKTVFYISSLRYSFVAASFILRHAVLCCLLNVFAQKTCRE